MQTHRDAQIVDWIGRLGAAGAEHVMRRFDLSRSVAYGRLNSMARDGLLERHAVLYARPGMYTATSAGLRWRGLEQLGACTVRPGGFEHAWQVAQTTVAIEEQLKDWPLFSEREIRAVEANEDKLFASIQVGAINDHPTLHRPDMAIVCPGGQVVAIEVELSIKSASRLAAICRGYNRARHIERAYYLAAAGPARAVERAARTTRATDRVRILPLDDIGRLAGELSATEDKIEVNQ
jgi:hypothetical protein